MSASRGKLRNTQKHKQISSPSPGFWSDILPTSPITPGIPLTRAMASLSRKTRVQHPSVLGNAQIPAHPLPPGGNFKARAGTGVLQVTLPEGLWPGHGMGAEKAPTNRMTMCNPVVLFSPLTPSISSPKHHAFSSQPLSGSGLNTQQLHSACRKRQKQLERALMTRQAHCRRKGSRDGIAFICCD